MLLFNKIKKILALFLIIAIFSCNNNQLNNTSDNSISTSNTGSVKMKIPSLLSNLGIKNTKTEDSRALMQADYMEITVLKDDKPFETFKEYNLFSREMDFSAQIKLSPGEYSLLINIYNINNSIDEPVSKAESDIFTVIKDETTYVNLTAIPVNPIVLQNNIVVSYNNTDKKHFKLYSDYSNDSDITVSGEETWFSFTATSEYSEILVSENVYNKNANIKVFTPDNVFNICENTIIKTEPEKVYYIGVAGMDYSNFWYSDIKFTNIDRFEIGFRELILENDSNISIETAKILTLNEPIECEYNGIDDQDYFAITMESGVTYDIQIEGNNTSFSGRFLSSEDYELKRFNETEEYYYNFTPAEDITIYLELSYRDLFENDESKLKILFQKVKDLPITIDPYLSYDINLENISSIEYIILNTSDNSVVKRNELTLENEYYNIPNVTFEKIENRSNLIVLCVARNSIGQILAVGTDSLEDIDSYYNPVLRGRLINIDVTYNSNYFTVDSEGPIGIDITLFNELLIYYPDTTTANIKIKVKNAPDESKLLNTIIVHESNNDRLESSYEGDIIFTPDISGHYILEVIAEFGDFKTTEEFRITALKGGEGAEGELDVTFE